MGPDFDFDGLSSLSPALSSVWPFLVSLCLSVFHFLAYITLYHLYILNKQNKTLLLHLSNRQHRLFSPLGQSPHSCLFQASQLAIPYPLSQS